MKILLTILMLVPLFTEAGHVVGNGGSGVKNGDTVYVLDLLEAGVERSPNFNPAVKNVFLDVLKAEIANRQLPLELVAQKISEIALKDKVFAHSIIDVFSRLSWRFVSYRLKATEDTHPVGDFEGEMVQLALRRSEVVFVDELYWNQLSPEHQAALVLHEILYAYITPVHMNQQGKKLIQSAVEVRKLVGLFFSTDFEKLPNHIFSERLGYRFPNSGLFKSSYTKGDRLLITRKNSETLFFPYFQFDLEFFDILRDFKFSSLQSSLCRDSLLIREFKLEGSFKTNLIAIENVSLAGISYFKWKVDAKELAPVQIDLKAFCAGSDNYGFDESVIWDVF